MHKFIQLAFAAVVTGVLIWLPASLRPGAPLPVSTESIQTRAPQPTTWRGCPHRRPPSAPYVVGRMSGSIRLPRAMIAIGMITKASRPPASASVA
jgi:hypothetical protein